MITQEHLEHWLSEMKYALQGVENEINADKVVLKGINVGKTGESYVSFEYLQEKATTLRGLIYMVEEDMRND